MEIYVKVKGKHLGPFTLEELENGLSSGEFSPDDKAFTSKTQRWMPLAEFPGLTMPEGVKAKKKNKAPVLLLLVILLLFAGGAGAWFLIPKDPDAFLAQAAEKYSQAVGLVVAVVPDESGEFGPRPFATAWAVNETTFATNAHVTEMARAFLDKGFDIYIVLNRSPQSRFRVIEATSHPRYQEASRNIEGEEPVDFNYDVGILRIDGKTASWFPVAPPEELRKLASGYRVAYLGFPMENLIKQGVDFRNPVANMQSGIVTAVSDYWLGDSGFAENKLIRHNLGATGGASGSPLFNMKGQVVALLNGGNVIGQISAFSESGDPIYSRAPSAVMINFAQRVDLLHDFVPELSPASGKPIKDNGGGNGDAAGEKSPQPVTAEPAG